MSINNKPQFITFEGGEGCGKSTQSRLLYQYLLSKKIPAIHTREIGGTHEAEKIRSVVIHSNLKSTSELLLIMAARYEHINQVIIPALLKGHWVICDRFIDSTACYQSNKLGIDIDEIYKLHKRLIVYEDLHLKDVDNAMLNFYSIPIKGIMPDITFFIDVAPNIALRRAKKRGNNNKFEEKQKKFHDSVYRNFKKITSLYSNRIVSVNTRNKNINQIQQFIREYLFNEA